MNNSFLQANRNKKILFVYLDRRVEYLIADLKKRIGHLDVLYVDINSKEFFFWINMLMCVIELCIHMIRKRKFQIINRNLLFKNLIRRPSVLKSLSLKIERHVKSMKDPPDLILAWSTFFGASELTEIPFAVIIDNYPISPISSDQKDRLRGWITIYDESFYNFTRQVFRKAKYIFTLSKWCKEGLLKEYNIDPSKVIVVGWGPAKKIEYIASPKKDDKTILGIGTDYFNKGLDVLIAAAEYLKAFSIVIIGKDPNFKNFRLPKNIKIFGYVSNKMLVDSLLKSQVFFIFSRFDPSPHVLWEAQACGCIVVGYDAYGISEAVINGETGVLLKTRDPLSVAENIQKLYLDRTRLNQMEKASINNYIKNGTWSLVSEKILQVISIGVNN